MGLCAAGGAGEQAAWGRQKLYDPEAMQKLGSLHECDGGGELCEMNRGAM